MVHFHINIMFIPEPEFVFVLRSSRRVIEIFTRHSSPAPVVKGGCSSSSSCSFLDAAQRLSALLFKNATILNFDLAIDFDRLRFTMLVPTDYVSNKYAAPTPTPVNVEPQSFAKNEFFARPR